MNRNKLFSDLKPVGGTKKHAFPLDCRSVYSMKAGMLVPAFVMDTIPDSSYDINSVNIIRTDAIQSTPFARMSSNMEYHFVPYSQIFRNFEKIYYERGDQQRNTTNSTSLSVSSKIPTFDYKNFFSQALSYFGVFRIEQDMYDLLLSIRSQVPVDSQFTYWDLVDDALGDIDNEKWMNVYTFLRGTLGYDDSYNPYTHDGVPYVDVFGRPCIEDQLRNFDLLGYGNLEAIFDAAYKYFVRFDSAAPTPLFNNVELRYSHQHLEDYTYRNYLLTLVNHIGLNPTQFEQTLFEDSFNNLYNIIFSVKATRLPMDFNLDIHPTILRMAAYLKIWSDFYRNSQYDIDVNYAYYFNYDYYVDSDGDVPTNKVFEMLKPRYRQWKKDVFTGGYPNAQFGSVAVSGLEQPFELVSTNSSPNGPYVGLYASSDVKGSRVVQKNDTTYAGNISDANSHVAKFSSSTGVSALSVRQALAMQKYRETLLRAGNRITSLQRAMFGDSSRYLEDEYSRFLNAYQQNIDFNAVPTTAEGNDRRVGELASNGVSTFGGNGFKFDSHDFGVIIGLQYILPEAEYESYGIDPMVTKSISSDFYKEAFQNLGLSPVFGFNYNLFRREYGQLNVKLNNTVFSYLARYWEYKLKYDKDHGLFYNSVPFLGTFIEGQIGDFANYVTPRPAVFPENISLPALYVNPNCLDAIFYASVNLQQGSDPFKVNMNHTGTMVLPMSVIGLPII